MAGHDSYEDLRKMVKALEKELAHRKRTGISLRAKLEEIEEIFALSIDLQCVADINTATFLKVNPAFSNLLGYREDELLERSFLDFIHPEDVPSTIAMIDERLKEGKEVINFKNRYRCMDGAYRWLEWVSHPIPEKGITIAVAHDITERKVAEAALKESETFIRTVMDHLPIGIAVNSVDPEVTFEYMNDKFAKIYRTTKEALFNPDTFWDAVYEDPIYREAMRKRVLDDCATGDPNRMYWEDVQITRKGEETTFITAMNIPAPDKQLMISTVWDVTEYNRAEATLRETKRLLEETQRISKLGGWEYDIASGRMTWTDEVYRIYGAASSDGLVDLDRAFGYYAPEHRGKIEHAFRRAAELGEPYDLELELIRKSGEHIWVRTMGQPAFKDGQVVRVTGNIMDITARKRAEDALRESEEQFKTMFEMASIGMAQADPQTGQWLRVNQKLCEMTGYSPGEMLTMRISDITHPEDRERDWEAFRNVIIGKWPDNRMEKRYIRKDGSIMWVNVNRTVLRDATGHPMRTMATIEDISDRIRDEEERAKLQNQLLQSQKMESVGRLAGGVAHDFNNMLGVILGYAELAIEQVDPSQSLHASLKEILDAATRSADLTRQLLAFARKQTVSPKVLEINDTIAGMLNMLHRIIGEDIRLVWRPGANLWPVKMDPSQVDQILANLSVNARDAIAGIGKITIETQNLTIDDAYCNLHAGFIPGDYVLLAVSDDGCGMEKEIIGNLFEPFFTTKGVGEGTGLGLATVYGIVKQNNGFINVYSEPDRGTTFKIYLPRFSGKTGRAQTEGVREPALRGHETVLIVEDEPATLKLTNLVLQNQGYQILTAGTPGEAIRLAEKHSGEIHLLMTDVVMPEMNGRDLAQKILSVYPNLKRLFMSGYTANVIAHHGVLDADVNFIQKPFSVEDLTAKVREVLDQK